MPCRAPGPRLEERGPAPRTARREPCGREGRRRRVVAGLAGGARRDGSRAAGRDAAAGSWRVWREAPRDEAPDGRPGGVVPDVRTPTQRGPTGRTSAPRGPTGPNL